MYFTYSTTEMDYLIQKDSILGEYIQQRGFIQRKVIPDVFTALIHIILGQQISTQAHQHVWNKLLDAFNTEVLEPKQIMEQSIEHIKRIGMSYKKAFYIHNLAKEILHNNINLQDLAHKSDDEVCKLLCGIKGIGQWSAQMLMIFSLQRKDILSYDDLAIRRGMEKLYNIKLNKELFKHYKESYSPYASVASLYLWEFANNHVATDASYLTHEQKIKIVQSNNSQYDGTFFYGVRSTKIYCRPSCKSKMPKRENIVFFTSSMHAQQAGFLPCKKCRPNTGDYPAVALACSIQKSLDLLFQPPLKGTIMHKYESIFKAIPYTKAHATEIFKSHFGKTPKQYFDNLRLLYIKNALLQKQKIEHIAKVCGFESVSSLYHFFAKFHHISPKAFMSKYAHNTASYGGIYTLEFGSFCIANDGRAITNIEYLNPADKDMQDFYQHLTQNALSDAMAQQLQEYFKQKRQSFDIALCPHGSEFQKRVWQELVKIPYGQTRTYKDIAKNIGNPNASRAVGNANNKNPIMIAIPCHRIVGSNNQLVGYAYGIDFKRRLLELEHAMPR